MQTANLSRIHRSTSELSPGAMPEALISAGTALINALAHVKRTRARLSVLIRLPPRYDEITQQVAQRRTINHKIVLEVSGIYSRHCSERELCTTVVGHTGFICPYQHVPALVRTSTCWGNERLLRSAFALPPPRFNCFGAVMRYYGEGN